MPNNENVKKLYDALSADGANVGTEAEFTEWLSKPGDEGDSNRKKVYDTFKADGADVGESYDEFAKWLDIAPANAEPKQEPWQPSEQEKAVTLKQLDRGVKKTLNTIGALKERVDNSREYFSRNGNGQTIAGEKRFNATTGKAEQTYLTPTGDKLADKQLADATSFEYRQATDMSVGGQIRRANQKLAELKEKKAESASRVHKEAVEDYEKNKAPLASVLFANTYQARQQTDKENSALDVAIRQTEELIKDLEEQKDREQGKDVGFWRGFGRVTSDPRTWDFGMGDMHDVMTMMNAESMKGGTKGEQEAYNEMLGAIYNKEQAEQQYGGNASFWNRAGVMTGYMPSFMVDFTLTGGGFEGLNMLGKAGAKAATKVVGKEVAKEIAEQGFKTFIKNNGMKGFGQYAADWTIKALGTTADDLLLRAPLMTNTVQAGKTVADIAERKLGDVVVNEDGALEFSNDKSWSSAIWQGEANAIIENFSEMFGTHLDKVVNLGNMSKLADLVGAKRLSGVLAKADAGALSGIMGQTHELFNKMGVSGYLGEVTEEYYGQLWRTMLNLDDAYQPLYDEQGNPVYETDDEGNIVVDENGKPVQKRENLIMSREFNGDILGGMALSMGMIGAGKTMMTGSRYLQMKHGVNKADARASALLGTDIWEHLKTTLDLTTNENIGTLAESIAHDYSFTEDEKAAVLTYMERSLMLRGFNLATLAQKRGAEQDENVQAMDECYIDGYNITDQQEMCDTKNMLELQREKLERMLSPEAVADIDKDPQGSLKNLGDDKDVNDAVVDYINAKNVYDGMMQRVSDDIDARVEQSKAMIDSYTNRKTGKVQGATMKHGDRRVYVVNGNIVQYDDKSGIDSNASDDSIIIRDAETGKLEQVSPSDVLNIDEALEPEEEKQTAETAIRQQYEQEANDKIGGIVTYNAGDMYVVMNDEGMLEYVRIAENKDGIVDNGDGTVNVTSDGNIIYPMPKTAIQEQADAENKERVRAYDEQRSAMNSGYSAEEHAENGTPRLAVEDQVTLRADDGSEAHGEIAEYNEDEDTYIVDVDRAVNGKWSVNLTSDEMRRLLLEYKGVRYDSGYSADSSDSDYNEANEADEANKADSGYSADSAELSAMERIPKGESGEPLYEQTDSDTAWDAIVEQAEGDEAMAQTVADGMVADKEAALKKAEKAKSKGGATIAEKIAAEKERKTLIEAAKHELAVWQKIAGTVNRRKMEADAERRRAEEEAAAARKAEEERLRAEREETERVEREAEEEAGGVSQNAEPSGMRAIPQTEEIDEYGNHFVLASDGNSDFGVIDAESGLKQAPIRLSMGDNTVDENGENHGYGLLHIEASRGEAIRNAGYGSVQDFVENVAKNYTDIREGGIIANNQTYLLELVDEHNNTLFIQLSKSGEYWTINSAGIFRKKYSRNKRKVFDRPALGPDTNTNISGVDSGNIVGVTTPAGNSPKTSENKDSEKTQTVKELGEKVTNKANVADKTDVEVSISSHYDRPKRVKEALKIDYNGQQRSDVLVGNSAASQQGNQGSTGDTATRERDEDGERTADRSGGIGVSDNGREGQRDTSYSEARQDGAGEQREVDENGHPFVVSAEGTTSFGEIREESGLPAAPIKLSEGYQDENGKGYGLIHIEANHGEQIRDAGFASVKDFVSFVAKNYDEDNIRVGKRRDHTGTTTYLIQVTDEHDNTLFIELSRDGSYWNVNSGGIFRKGYSNKKETVAKTEPQQPNNAVSTGSSLSADNKSGISSTEPNGEPTVSEGKDSEKSRIVKELREKNKADKANGANAADEANKANSVELKVVTKAVGNDGKPLILFNANAINEDDFDGELELPIQNWNRDIAQNGFWFTPDADFARKWIEEWMGFDEKRVSKVTLDLRNPLVIDANGQDWKNINGKSTDKWAEYAEQNGYDGLIIRNVLEGTDSEYTSKVVDDYCVFSPKQIKDADWDGTAELGEMVAQAEAETNTEPTEKQIEAGNYKKGHVQVGAFNITIENPKGSVRRGVGADGKAWETTMQNTYGYIRGTEGVDGDHIDVFLSNDIDGWDGRMVFVVDQRNADGSFDEHKVMLGFNDINEAEAAYMSNYEKGWQGLGTITGVAIDDFEKWIASSHRKTKAFAEYKAFDKASGASSGYSKDSSYSGDSDNSGANRVNEDDSKDEIEVVEISSTERTEMETRIVDWLSEENLSRAVGKSREEIFDEFGNELMPIAFIPTQFISLVSPTLKDRRIYCGKGYFIDHALRNHAGAGEQVSIEDVDVSKYLSIQTVLDNPDHIKETYVDGKRTVVFIKKIGRFFAELTQVEENGKVVLHKSFFNQKKEPYAKLNDIRQKDTSSEGGTTSISHTAEAAPAISLQSRGDVMLNDEFFNSDKHLIEPQKEGSDLVPTPNSDSSEGKGSEKTQNVKELREKNKANGANSGYSKDSSYSEDSGNNGADKADEGVVKNGRNNHSERGKDHSPISIDARIEANIKAIELAKQLLESGEQATEKQMQTLRKFSGWGGLGKAFSEGTYYAPNQTRKKLLELLGEKAYNEAVMSANSAYYTPAYVIDALWDIAEQMGFKGGNILEGSAGIGNILGQMPARISERSDIHAVEIDSTAGGILSLLYPDAKVEIQGFEQTRIPNGSVDLAITNVPFVTGLRVNDTTGDKDLSKKFHNIHDFCIAKNVRKLREGGVGIFITSSGTMDSSHKLREWIVNEGGSDFVGAFRMHNKTFGGTGVTSDIIVIRKRVNGVKSAKAIDVSTVSGERVAEYDTGETRKIKGKETPIIKTLSMDYNRYFIEHPENMAGEMHFAFEKGDTFRPTSKGLYPRQGKKQEQMLDDWANSADWADSSYSGDSNNSDYSGNSADVEADKKVGEMFVRDGKLYINSTASAQPLDVNANKVKGHTKVECFEAYAAIKDALAEVLAYQSENEDDKGLKPLLTKLNKAYDNFVDTYGHFNKNTAIAFLRNDVDYANVSSVETYEEQGNAKGEKQQKFGKADVMRERVVEKDREPKPTNVKDGIIASIFKFGRVDVRYIAEALNDANKAEWTEADMRRELVESGYCFEDPLSRQLEVSYQYLSGNVCEKLRQARENNENGEYDRNIKALQEVLPLDIPAHLIDFTLGSSWIEPKLYEEYVKDRTDVDVRLTSVGGTWFMKEPYYTSYEKNRAMGVTSELLGRTIMGHSLIEAAIQNRSITVSTTKKRYDGTTETITDKEATRACCSKIDEIRQDFKDWARQKMQSDPAMSERMEREYNDMFNNYVPMSIPADFVPEYFGGASHKFKMRPHQGKAIVRGTMQPLLLAHEVGTGKTFTLISTAMEMRRLGTARKPMIVVQNATVGQFVASAKALYPSAKILTLEDADRNAEGRKNFYAKIRYNDWDMIVVPQSTFEFIPDSEEREMRYIQDKIEEKMLVLEMMREADHQGKSMITRQAEREIEQLEEQLAELSDAASKKRTANDEKKRQVALQNAEVEAMEMLDRRTDEVENFDDMGIDALLVDEAHEYKHLGFATAMQRGVKGVDPSYSKKSQGVYLKTQAVLEKNNGRNVIFATGTPISNTAAEIWTFMRYLMPADTMKDYGIYYFDDFVRNFGNIQQMLEFSTSGKFKESNRFAGYVNLPELARIWSGVSDIVLTKDAGGVSDKIPEMESGKAQDLYMPQTRSLRGIMKFVKGELEKYEQMSGKEKKENSHIPLTMYGIAKAAAVDARLVQVDAVDEPNSKTNEAVRQTLRTLKETASYKGTVAIFADTYQNKESGFNLYDDIRSKLIAEGVPADEIVVMKPGMSVKKKMEIFDKVNRGEVRVILGSTFTLGTGVNVQERLHTLIHLDAPNRPMDYTQRNGRILRQGNLHKAMGKPVRILRFGVEDSLDVTAYQRLKTKGAIADSVMNSKQMLADSMNNRALEEAEDVFGDTVAQLSGSEYAMLKNNAEKNIRKYASRKKQWEADQMYIYHAKPRVKGLIKDAEKTIEESKRYLEVLQSEYSDKQNKEITIGKHRFSNVDEMEKLIKEHNKSILAEVKKIKDGDIAGEQTRTLTIEIGNLAFEVKTELHKEMSRSGGSLFSEVHRTMSYSCKELGLQDVPVKQGLLRNAVQDIAENVITGKDLTERIEVAENLKNRYESELEQLEQREGKPFEYEEELAAAQKQYDEYAEQMKRELAEKEAKYAEMDASVEAASGIADAEDTDEDTLYRIEEERFIEKKTYEDTVRRMKMKYGLRCGGITLSVYDEDDLEQLRMRLEKDVWEKVAEQFHKPNVLGCSLPAMRCAFVFTNKTPNVESTWWHENAHIMYESLQLADKEDCGLAALEWLRKQGGRGLTFYKETTTRYEQSSWGEEGAVRLVQYLVERYGADGFLNYDFEGINKVTKLAEALRNIFIYGKEEATRSDILRRRRIQHAYGTSEAVGGIHDRGRVGEAEARDIPMRSSGYEESGRVQRDAEAEHRSGTESERSEEQGRIERIGEGLYSDDDVCYENDPISKALGYPRGTKKQRSEFAQRVRRRMVARAEELAKKLHLGNVEIVTDISSLNGTKARAKGWFSKKTGKIVIVIPNHATSADVERTLLHEALAHYGLRVLFGEHFDTFLDNVFNNADKDVRGRIVELAARNGWDFRKATEEYLAGLAERTDFENVDRSWWSKIKELFMAMLHKIGFEGFSGVTLTDNELRYILWRSYENLAEPGRYRSILGEAADVAKQYELKVGNYAEMPTAAANVAESEIMAVNERFNEKLEELTEDNADLVIFSLGRPSAILRAAGVEDKPMKLYGNKVIKKMKKHGFALSELKDLPRAVANPIAVFNNYDRTGNRAILTELRTEQGNFLVTVDLGKGVEDIDFNIVTSVFGKTDSKIVDWLNSGLATYINKEKALNYLHHSAPIAEALSNPRLSSATKIVESFENPSVKDIETDKTGEEDVLYREGDPAMRERAEARERYERRVRSGMFQSQEALQDSMLGLKEAMLSIAGEDKNIEDIDGFENAYLGENRLSSVNKAEADAFAHLVFNPLLDEVAKLAKNNDERMELTDYMMAKHGLERNQYMRAEAIKNGVDVAKAELTDYAGLTSLTLMDDVTDAEADARRMVEAYESEHDTATLWEKVNAVSKATLKKHYECGMMSKETYEKIDGMYAYYIPLRGFDEKTSGDAYAYLSHRESAFNAPIKKAKGRGTKADDPFANMQSMAESAIMQGNRNKLVKQRFFNFVQNHPSDLVSVSEMWVEYDMINDEWKPVFPDNINGDDTAEEVERKLQDFESKMQELAEQYPDYYKCGKDAENIPYRVLAERDKRQHQVVVRRNGRDYVITINGNPRAAQALNGLTNPDNDIEGAAGTILRLGEALNRQLSAFYTTRNPDFIVSNFMRDMLYSNTMVWVKENPRYALRFNRNFSRVNPARMKLLLAKHRKGELDMSDKTEAMFRQFMMNGGETGYANVRDIEQHKNDIRKALKRANGKLKLPQAWSMLTEQLDELNRAIENCARFAAYMTSREMGRTIDRAIYDAKEISVNFNKKGSGSKFLGKTGQTKLGNTSAFVSGLGRGLYVFWNAAIQGTTNYGKQMKRHPAKALTATAAMFMLGATVAYLGCVGSGDDDDDKNSYYNLPDYVRRSNILFRVGDSWISIPLSIEYRAVYGLGELAMSTLSGKEHLTGGELAEAITAQMTQLLPLDVLEGGGGWNNFAPSAAKPLWEAYVIKKSWTGMPLYKDTPWNEYMPEWTKAYKSANTHLVGLAEVLNEASGGDRYTKGAVDINPAKVEYVLNGYFSGVSGTIDKLVKTGETITGAREYDPRSFPIINRVVKAGDERTEYRAVNNEYHRLKKEHDIVRNRLRHYEDDTNRGIFDYAEKIDFLHNSPEYARYEIFEKYILDIEWLNEEIKEATDEEKRKKAEAELNELKKAMIKEMNQTR